MDPTEDDPTLVPAEGPTGDGTYLSMPSAPGEAPAGATSGVTGSQALPAPGDRIGRYQIVAELGRGGVGVVYRALDVTLERPVAIKMLLAERATKSALERFKTEAKATARLDHPCIVSLLDVGAHEGRPYMVMPLVEGASLREVVVRHGTLAPQAVLQVGLALADAMAYAHEREILHRDLKPQNVLVEPNGRVKVTDFGLARLLGDSDGADADATLIRLTVAGQALGTPAYMPPEQARGDVDRMDVRSDVYGLGAVLYAAASGRAPAEGDTFTKLLRAAIGVDPPSLEELRPDLPAPVAAVIHRCLAKAPEQRFQTAAEVVAALRACWGLSPPALAGAAAPAPSFDPDGATVGHTGGPAPSFDPDGATVGHAGGPTPSFDPEGATVGHAGGAAPSFDAEEATVASPDQSAGWVPPAAAPRSAELSGQRFGPYVGVEEVARGAQGVVVRARHVGSGQQVALKLLLSPGERAQKRFQREVKSLAKLRHPNLPQVLEVGDVGGLPFVALELIEGKSLKERLRINGVPPFAWTVGVMATVARAVDYCHQLGALHRDLKPANVVIEANSERPVVVDFGLVLVDPEGPLDISRASRLSFTGEALGTPAYMSPEQAGDTELGPVSPRSDVYGLGATLFCLLTGRDPFEGSLAQVMFRVLQEAPPEPRQLNAEVPPALERVCLRALAKAPGERQPSARAFADELEDALGGGAEPASVRRRTLPLAVLAALGLASLASVLLRSEPRDPATVGGIVGTTPASTSFAVPPPASALPTASSTPAPAPSSSATGSVLWEREVEGEFWGEQRAGPWLIRPGSERGAAIDPQDGSVTWLPGAVTRWFWDAPRQRFLGALPEDEGPARLVAFSPGGSPEDLLLHHVRVLATSHDRLYVVSEEDELFAFDAVEPGEPLWRVGLSSRVDVAPILLDASGDGAADRVLVIESQGRATLFSADDGAELAGDDLPGPVGYPPALLGGSALPTTLVVGCSDGWLTRLTVTSQALLHSQGYQLDSPITASPVVFRDGSSKAATHVAVATAEAGLNALTVELHEVVWAAGPPAANAFPRGEVVALDFDRDGADELAVFWEDSQGSATAWVFSARGERIMALGWGRLMSIPGGVASVSRTTVRAWGRWDPLPEPQPVDTGQVDRNLIVGAWGRAYADAANLPWEKSRPYFEYLSDRVTDPDPDLVAKFKGAELAAAGSRFSEGAARANGLTKAERTERMMRLLDEIYGASQPPPLDRNLLIERLETYGPPARSLERLLETVERPAPGPPPPEPQVLEVKGMYEQPRPGHQLPPADMAPLPQSKAYRFLAWFDTLRRAPPIVRGLTLRAPKREAANLLQQQEWLEATFVLEESESLELILEHRSAGLDDWGFSLITITCDGEPVIERYAPPTSFRAERFALGQLPPGEHVIRIQALPSPTPYRLLEFRVAG